MECESCFESPAEVEGIVEHEYMHLCRKCALIDGAVLLKKPTKINIEDSYKRQTVRQVLERMSGIERPKIYSKSPHIDDLRIVKKKLEEEDKKINEEIKIITNDSSEEANKWSFSKVLQFFKKEKKPDATKGPSPEDLSNQGQLSEEEQRTKNMRLHNMRKEASASEGLLDL